MHNVISESPSPHYYGDIVRVLFLAASGIMLVGLPAFMGYTHLPTMVSVIAVLVLGCAAGLTSPAYFWSAVTNVTIAVMGFLVFESSAVYAYARAESFPFVAANIVLGFIFIAAVYYSVKTLRGAYRET